MADVGDLLGWRHFTPPSPCRGRRVWSAGSMTERRAIFRGRLRRPGHESAGGEDEVIEIEPGALSGIFAAPKWLRDLGFSSWLLVGAGAALIGAIWLLAQTQTIVMPVITAGIIAAVALPLVDWLRRHGIPRGVGAGLVFLLIMAIAAAVGLIVLTGIASQAASISERLREGAARSSRWFATSA